MTPNGQAGPFGGRYAPSAALNPSDLSRAASNFDTNWSRTSGMRERASIFLAASISMLSISTPKRIDGAWHWQIRLPLLSLAYFSPSPRRFWRIVSM